MHKHRTVGHALTQGSANPALNNWNQEDKSMLCKPKKACAINILSANLTVSKRPGTSYRMKIHFAVFNHLYLLFPSMKLVETL